MSTILIASVPALADPPAPNEPCDRCNAAAMVRVEGTFGSLVFCLHHLSEACKSDAFTAAVTSRSIPPTLV